MLKIHSIKDHIPTTNEVYDKILTKLSHSTDCKTAYGIVNKMRTTEILRKELMKNGRQC